MLEPGRLRPHLGGRIHPRPARRRARRRCRRLAALLEAIGPVTVTQTCAARAGASWRSTARSRRSGPIAGDRLGALCAHRFVRRLALEVMTEAVEVARAEEVRLEKVSGTLDLDWIALTDRRSAAATGSACADRRSTRSCSPSGGATGGCAPRCCRRSSAAASRRSTSSTARSSPAATSTASPSP